MDGWTDGHMMLGMNKWTKEGMQASEPINQPHQYDILCSLLIPTQKTSIGFYFILHSIVYKIV